MSCHNLKTRKKIKANSLIGKKNWLKAEKRRPYELDYIGGSGGFLMLLGSTSSIILNSKVSKKKWLKI